MDAIRKILVPTDFSPHADEAFRVAHDLAGILGAEVVPFHIAQPRMSSTGMAFATRRRAEISTLFTGTPWNQITLLPTRAFARCKTRRRWTWRSWSALMRSG